MLIFYITFSICAPLVFLSAVAIGLVLEDRTLTVSADIYQLPIEERLKVAKFNGDYWEWV